MPDPTARARELWTLLEPVHAVVYFAAEPRATLQEAGYRGFWMGYFAGRAAPLGPVGPEIVHALFHNFRYDRVGRALPDAWTFAPPETALQARLRGSVAALERAIGGQDVAVERAAALAAQAARAAPSEGRGLFAANRALPEPEHPLARLWHGATLLREHRGDGHVAALVAAGIGGRESHVFHSLAGGTPRAVYTTARDFDDAEWDGCVARLADRGLVDGGVLTPAGRALKDEIEARTDALAAAAYAVLSDAEQEELVHLLRPIARAVVHAGDIPVDSPMGLNLRESLA